MAQNFEIIPAVKRPDFEDRHLRVAAYCRVSTEADEQLNSLESQTQYFSSLISENQNWEFVGLYPEKGKSGTTRKKRPEFNKMIALAENGGIDLIVTKEVSRFGRNVVDTCGIARNLRAKGVYIWFLDDELRTENIRDMDRLTDLAAQAERESQRTSKRVRWGQTQRMKQGVVFGRDMLGYTVKGGKLYINEAEVPIVKLIYRLFLEGDGTHVIARKLREAGYLPKNPDGTAHYKNDWSNTVILRVLRNEKYCGDLLQKKTFTPDPLTHAKKYNRGEEDKILIRDHHEAIVDRETWEAVQRELARRSPTAEQKAKHSNRYWCSGKVYCGVCGAHYVGHTKHLKTIAEPYKSWCCIQGLSHGRPKEVRYGDGVRQVGCDNKSVNDKVLQEVIRTLLSFVSVNRDEIQKELLEDIASVQNIQTDCSQREQFEAELESLKKRKKKLITMYADDIISESDFNESKQECDSRITVVQGELAACKTVEQQQQTARQQVQAYIDAIDEILSFPVGEDSERIYKAVTEKIIVYPGHILNVHLSCLPYPVRIHYTSQGRGKNYTIDIDSVEPLPAVPDGAA